MVKNIRCAKCRFARIDKHASEGAWKAWECGNPDSEYFRDLLNITPNGDKQYHITWSGCPCGESEVAK